jgi:ATP-dependent Clp protease ATP-binding subunit ClpC
VSGLGTEHLLLGLLRLGDGVARNALSTLGMVLDDARRRVEEIVAGIRRADLPTVR